MLALLLIVYYYRCCWLLYVIYYCWLVVVGYRSVDRAYTRQCLLTRFNSQSQCCVSRVRVHSAWPRPPRSWWVQASERLTVYSSREGNRLRKCIRYVCNILIKGGKSLDKVHEVRVLFTLIYSSRVENHSIYRFIFQVVGLQKFCLDSQE